MVVMDFTSSYVRHPYFSPRQQHGVAFCPLPLGSACRTSSSWLDVTLSAAYQCEPGSLAGKVCHGSDWTHG
jgi:hypothetical protein